jgi:hypothetical protein
VIQPDSVADDLGGTDGGNEGRAAASCRQSCLLPGILPAPVKVTMPGALRKQFDRIFLRRTGFVTLDRLLKRLHANKAELLMVLGRPEIAGRSAPGHAAMSAGLPGCFSGSGQDLRQARRRGLGLSGQPAQGGRARS